MSFVQVSMRIDSSLLSELDKLAKGEFKRRSDVIRDALIEYVKRQNEISDIKEKVTQQFLEGKIGFDDFSRLVGIETATQIKSAKETLEESIASAKRDSKKK